MTVFTGSDLSIDGSAVIGDTLAGHAQANRTVRRLASFKFREDRTPCCQRVFLTTAGQGDTRVPDAEAIGPGLDSHHWTASQCRITEYAMPRSWSPSYSGVSPEIVPVPSGESPCSRHISARYPPRS